MQSEGIKRQGTTDRPPKSAYMQLYKIEVLYN